MLKNSKMDANNIGKISLGIDKTDPANPLLNKLSEGQIVAGFEWDIRALKYHLEGEQLKLEFSVCCNESTKEKLWMAKARICNPSSNGFDYNWIYYFSNENANVQMQCSFSYDPDQEHEQKINIAIEVLRSIPSLMEFDTNLEIIVCEEKENGQSIAKNDVIAVNKYVLAGYSNYFRNLFFGNWAENSEQQDEIKPFSIKEETKFDADAFKKMIYASLATGWMLGNELFESMILCSIGDDKKLKYKMAFNILKLSVKYDMPMIQNCCEEYFYSQFNDKDFSKMELLEEAGNLGIQKLKERTLNSITAIDFGRNFRTNLQIQSRLGEQTQEELMNQIEKNAETFRGYGRIGYSRFKGNGWDDDDFTF